MQKKKKLTPLISFDDTHTHENLVKLRIIRYKISEILFTSTLDSASKNNIDIQYLQSYLSLLNDGVD